MNYSCVISVRTILYLYFIIIDKINTTPLGTTSVTISDGTFQDLDTSTIENWSSQDVGATFVQSTTSLHNDDFVNFTVETKKATSHAVASTQQHSSVTNFNTPDTQTTEAMETENSSERYQAVTTIVASSFNSIKESDVPTTETVSVMRNRIGQTTEEYKTIASESSVSDIIIPHQVSVQQNVTSFTQSVPQYNTIMDHDEATVEDLTSSTVEGIDDKPITHSTVTENKIDVIISRDIINPSSSIIPNINKVSSTEASTDETILNYGVETHEYSVVTEEWFKRITTPNRREKYKDAMQFETTQDTQNVTPTEFNSFTESKASVSYSNGEVNLTSTLSHYSTTDRSINDDDIGEEASFSTTLFDDSKAHTKSWTKSSINVTYPSIVVVTKSTQENNISFKNPGTPSNNHITQPTGTTFFSTTESVHTAAAVADITVPLVVAGCGFILLVIVSINVWIKGRRNRGRIACHRLRTLDVRKNTTSPADVPRFMMAVNKFPDHEIL